MPNRPRATRPAQPPSLAGVSATSLSISGRYEGEMTSPTNGRQLLELRIDVDERYPNSPVVERVSGDLYQRNSLNVPGTPPSSWRVYRESWIVDRPRVTRTPERVLIAGTVRYWKGTHPATRVQIRIPVGGMPPVGPAEVQFLRQGALPSAFSCIRKSDSFRDLAFEIDVCQSVDRPPLVPRYATDAHPLRPADVPARLATIEEMYREAGVNVTIPSEHSRIDDSAADFQRWSPAELHDAMETHFSRFAQQWPRWEMWGLLAGTFDDTDTGGLMFDAAADFGGAGRGPERQGFAVFRNHPWFANLPAGTPASVEQAEALRKYLYTWVHEAGHAFNFLHSWDKNRPDALSWMNYDWKYDNRNGVNAFWSNFRFRFDDEELIHLRHGARPAVMMGGDPWASGGQLEAPPGAEHLEAAPGAMSQVEGNPPIEVLVRSKEFFEFMEPVAIEVRIRNLLPDLPMHVDTRLNPEYGSLTVHIRRPDGRIVEYSPIMCRLAEPSLRILRPAKGAEPGEDRYSEELALSYGRYGFYFSEPGEYLIRALYQGAGDILIPSDIHRIRVGHPVNKEADRLAQDFFSFAVGMSLYLKGSPSPTLTRGMAILEEVLDRFGATALATRVATTVTPGIVNPFFRVGDDKNRRLVKYYRGDPGKAVALTEKAVRSLQHAGTKPQNLVYHNLVRQRVTALERVGDLDKARREVSQLHQDLAARGVHPPVLESIEALKDTLARRTRTKGASRARKLPTQTPKRRRRKS
jgi:hypothetical protein